MTTSESFAIGDRANAADAQHARGKLTACERVELLFDENSFTQIDSIEGEGVITGYGTVHGRRIFCFAKDYTVLQGSLSTAHAAKITHLQARAIAERAPLICLFDSDGMRLEDGFAALSAYGEMVRYHIQASGVIPQISLVMGPCIGSDAFAASLTDFIFMVADISSLFVTGPEITNRLTGEDLTAQGLGGAKLHSETSGLADAVFTSDIEALSQLRRFIDFLPLSVQDSAPQRPSFDDPCRTEIVLDMLVPDDAAASYDIKDLILRIVDEADFFELQKPFAQNIVIGFGRMDGHSVGIVANQPSVLGGVLDANAAQKATHFIQFCGRFNLPILTFIDTPGFLPGLNQEEKALAAQGAKLISAYATPTLPKITVIIGQAYGAAFIMMGSQQIGAHRVFTWPSAKIALKKTDTADMNSTGEQIQGAIDAVIQPSATRVHILEALSALRQKVLVADTRLHNTFSFEK